MYYLNVAYVTIHVLLVLIQIHFVFLAKIHHIIQIDFFLDHLAYVNKVSLIKITIKFVQFVAINVLLVLSVVLIVHYAQQVIIEV